ncbi:hypothetical protein [Pseudochryseolinea flava]|uniref:hypothetical protein n=1 Tax=Pseudochryseolinea flava TaxID=2059302 RepID=UPI001C885155|nr:hypothetical protein [Pseudochryseolinea flava]
MKTKLTSVLLCILLMMTHRDVFAQFTRDEAKVAMQCFNNEFYNQYGTYGNSFKAMYYANTNRHSRQDFWREIEAIETLIDAYQTNNDADFKNKIRYLYHGHSRWLWNHMAQQHLQRRHHLGSIDGHSFICNF